MRIPELFLNGKYTVMGEVVSFLNANGVPYVLDDSTAIKSPADITAEASRYTVLLECLR